MQVARGKAARPSQNPDLSMRMKQLLLQETEKQRHLKRLFMETEQATHAFEDPRFTELFEEYMKLQINAEQELLLPEEPDNGNVEYKLKFDGPNMARVEHLTTQMAFRLNEGNGTAYYQIGVLDSG